VYDPFERDALATELARAFLDAPWTVEGLSEAGAGSLDRWPSWITALAMSVLAVHRTAPAERPDELRRLIRDFLRTRSEPDGEPEPAQIIARLPPPTPVLTPRLAPPPARLPADRRPPVVELPSVPVLAERLELSLGQLAWLADVRGLERTVAREQLRNYRYRTLPRASGMPRVIEAPKARLKEIQRWLGDTILSRVPAHASAHGFVRGRSAVTHAQLHCGQAAVLRLESLPPGCPAQRPGRRVEPPLLPLRR
jgi:RNA-directed DNA polymerase